MFKFSDYTDRIPLWFPSGYKGFQELPKNFDPFEEPIDEPDPSAWIIIISGA